MTELQIQGHTPMEGVETVDVSWLHHSQKGEYMVALDPGYCSTRLVFGQYAHRAPVDFRC